MEFRPSNIVRFKLGRIVATRGALSALNDAGQQPAEFLHRHVSGDWGELSDDDKKLNDAACVNEGYDRSVTTLLLPEEY